MKDTFSQRQEFYLLDFSFIPNSCCCLKWKRKKKKKEKIYLSAFWHLFLTTERYFYQGGFLQWDPLVELGVINGSLNVPQPHLSHGFLSQVLFEK